MKKNKKDAYEKFAGDLKNEADLKEELDAEGLDVDEEVSKHFDDGV